MPRLYDQFGKPLESSTSDQVLKLRQEIVRTLRAKYDLAQTTTQNELHWSQADSLSPNSSNSPQVRRRLRDRSRYEVHNNGYVKGILLTIANDTVGSGPKLQITDKRFSTQQRQLIEYAYVQRAKEIRLRLKLWQMRFARASDGETFAFRFTDNRLRNGVTANLRVIETDQVTSPFWKQDATEYDGIRIDPNSGEPTAYFLANSHPGEMYGFRSNPLAGNWIDSRYVCHWLRRERNWLRGIPELSPSLPLCALLRRYTLAVVQNAEIAADFTVLMSSKAAPNTNPFTTINDNSQNWFDNFPIDRGTMTVVPDDHELKQLDPKQPVTVYDAFVNALIQEIARPVLMPRNMALGNSGQYNMASGTLDRQTYNGAILQDRLFCEEEVLEPDLAEWWKESQFVYGYFGDEVEPISRVIAEFAQLANQPPQHTFIWDVIPEHTDPDKVAAALERFWVMGAISDTDIQRMRFNRSDEEHYENMKRQQQIRKELGLPQPMDSSKYMAGTMLQVSEKQQDQNNTDPTDSTDNPTGDSNE